MTYRELYLAALRMVCESESEGDTADYEDRAGYLLATFCAEHSASDNRYRKEKGQGAQPPFTKAFVELSERFPLSPVFAPIAQYYLAAMLCMDENEEMSDRYFGRYTEALAALLKDLPSTAAPIRDRYRGLLI